MSFFKKQTVPKVDYDAYNRVIKEAEAVLKSQQPMARATDKHLAKSKEDEELELELELLMMEDAMKGRGNSAMISQRNSMLHNTIQLAKRFKEIPARTPQQDAEFKKLIELAKRIKAEIETLKISAGRRKTRRRKTTRR